jgi:hypothetical protein
MGDAGPAPPQAQEEGSKGQEVEGKGNKAHRLCHGSSGPGQEPEDHTQTRQGREEKEENPASPAAIRARAKDAYNARRESKLRFQPYSATA